MELAVVNLPDISLVFTNYVYVSKMDKVFLPYAEENFVCIKNSVGKEYVFAVKEHSKIEPGCIALGKSHRQTVFPPDGVATPKISCSSFPREGRYAMMDAIEISFSLNLLRAVRPTKIAEASLSAYVQQTYAGQVFYVGQIMYSLFNDIPCELRVDSIKIPVTEKPSSASTSAAAADVSPFFE